MFGCMFWKFKSKNMSSDLRPFEFIIYILYQALSHTDITSSYFAHFKYSSFSLSEMLLLYILEVVKKAAIFMLYSTGRPHLILNFVSIASEDTTLEISELFC